MVAWVVAKRPESYAGSGYPVLWVMWPKKIKVNYKILLINKPWFFLKMTHTPAKPRQPGLLCGSRNKKNGGPTNNLVLHVYAIICASQHIIL